MMMLPHQKINRKLISMRKSVRRDFGVSEGSMMATVSHWCEGLSAEEVLPQTERVVRAMTRHYLSFIVCHDQCALMYCRFRNGIKDLEVMMQNLIVSAFETVTTVEQGVEVLDIFMHLSSREVKPSGTKLFSASLTLISAHLSFHFLTFSSIFLF